MNIIDFDFDPAWLARFLDFPQALYAGDPGWLPDASAARQLAPGRAEADSAVWRNFLAVADDGRIVGRVTAILNPRVRAADGRLLAQIGFFECVDDEPTARLLVDTAAAWLRAQSAQAQVVVGPMNFDTWHAYRLRTAGFDQPTFVLEPYNPPYYVSLFTSLGFTPLVGSFTRFLPRPAEVLPAWAPYHRAAVASGYSFRHLNPMALDDELALVYQLSLETFRTSTLFVEIPRSEFHAMYAPLARALDPQMFTFVLDPSGLPVGFSFAFPDSAQPATINHKTIGLLPRSQRLGLGAALVSEVYQRFLAAGYQHIQQCLMVADGRSSVFARDVGTVTREYCLYSRPID